MLDLILEKMRNKTKLETLIKNRNRYSKKEIDERLVIDYWSYTYNFLVQRPIAYGNAVSSYSNNGHCFYLVNLMLSKDLDFRNPADIQYLKDYNTNHKIEHGDLITRECYLENKETCSDIIKVLDKIMEEYRTTPERLVLYRYISNDDPWCEIIKEIGKVGKLTQFFSTTYDSDWPTRSINRTKIKIYIPEGVKGVLFMEPFSVYAMEHEFLLSHKLFYKVIAKNTLVIYDNENALKKIEL